MATRIAIECSDADLAAIDAAVQAGRYSDRAAALRAGLGELLRKERDIARYIEAYREHPQDAGVGEASLALLAEAVRADRERH